LKKSFDDPESMVPYLMSVCLARSSADSIGDCIRSAVKNAARLAVYEEMRISVKNHQTLPTIRPDIDLPQQIHSSCQVLYSWPMVWFNVPLYTLEVISETKWAMCTSEANSDL